MSKGKGRKSAKVAQRHGFDSAGRLGHDTDYAVNVSELTALATSVFLSGCRLIHDLIGDADVMEYRGRTQLDPPSRLVRRPMATVTRRAWLGRLAVTMAVYNGSWIDRGTMTDAEGLPLSLVPVAPPRVSVWSPDVVYLDGERIDPDRLVWVPRFTLPTVQGDSAWLVRLARDAVAAAWAAQSYRSDFWEAGGAPTTVLTSDQYIDDTQAESIADRWVDRRSAGPGKPAVLGKGAKAELFGADVSTKGASDAIERLNQDVARDLGIPAWLLNVQSAAGSMTYSNASSAGLDLVRFTLRPGYAGPIGDMLTDVLPGDAVVGRSVVVSVDKLTYGTILERFQAYAIATGGASWMRPDEVRDELHMPIDPAFSLDPAGAPAPALEAIP